MILLHFKHQIAYKYFLQLSKQYILVSYIQTSQSKIYNLIEYVHRIHSDLSFLIINIIIGIGR